MLEEIYLYLVIFLGCFSFWGNAAGRVPKAEVHFVNVGQGNFSVARLPHNGDTYNLIVDCGYKKRWVSRRIVNPILGEVNRFLSNRVFPVDPTRQIEVDLVVSHADVDHYELASSTHMGNFFRHAVRIRRALLGGSEATWGQTQAGKTFQAWIGGRGATVEYANTLMPDDGTAYFLRDEDDEKIMHSLEPAENKLIAFLGPNGRNKNSQSVMVYLKYSGISVLLPGDATGVTMEAALANNKLAFYPVNIFLASHHGADTEGSNTESWFNFLKPQIMIFSVGPNTHKHPTDTVINNFRRAGYYLQAFPDSKVHPMHVNIPNSGGLGTDRSTSVALYSTNDQGHITLSWEDSNIILGKFTKAIEGETHAFRIKGRGRPVPDTILFEPNIVSGHVATIRAGNFAKPNLGVPNQRYPLRNRGR